MGKVMLHGSHLRHLTCTNKKIQRKIPRFYLLMRVHRLEWGYSDSLEWNPWITLCCQYMFGSEGCLSGHRMVSLLLRMRNGKASQVPPVSNKFPSWRLSVFYEMAWVNIQQERNPINFKQMWMGSSVCMCDLWQTKVFAASATEISF